MVHRLQRSSFACTAILLVTVAAGSLHADQRKEAKQWVDFGMTVAQRGLWREAIYRWEKATQIDPTYAAAFNNLAVAYERDGQVDKARQSYERALQLAPKDQQIRQNYELFKEVNDRVAAERENP